MFQSAKSPWTTVTGRAFAPAASSASRALAAAAAAQPASRGLDAARARTEAAQSRPVRTGGVRGPPARPRPDPVAQLPQGHVQAGQRAAALSLLAGAFGPGRLAGDVAVQAVPVPLVPGQLAHRFGY